MAGDLRDWIALLESEGQLARVTVEVDPAEELAAICRRTLDNRGPAILFENIGGHQASWCTKLFHGGLATTERIALMLGLPKDASRDAMVDLIRRRFRERVAPIMVQSGPIKENIRCSDIDIEKIPVPTWHPRDGGKYINTWAGVVTRDPDGGDLNVGMYRGMIAGPDAISCLLLTSQHWGAHFDKYRRLGKPMPVAVVYGCDPSFGFCAANAIARGVSEYEVMGAIRQAPVELVKCETSDLLVPASAEIVIEGEISGDPQTWEFEGPFGEFNGYYAASRRRRPTIKVKCITHRNDPIYRGTLEGAGPGHPNETGSIYGVSSKAVILNVLEDARIPGVIDVRPGPINVVKIRQSYGGQAHQVASALWASDVSEYMCKNVMVVDEDIDLNSQAAIDWAFGTRVNPKEDLILFPGTRGGVVDPSLSEADRDEADRGTGRQNRLLIDATWDLTQRHHWMGSDLPPLSTPVRPDVGKAVANRWSEYGIALPERKSKR